jgi:hypothetical protein
MPSCIDFILISASDALIITKLRVSVKFKCVFTLVTNRNYVHDKIKSRRDLVKLVISEFKIIYLSVTYPNTKSIKYSIEEYLI